MKLLTEDQSAQEKRLRIKGHKLIRRWNNADTADGYCACGEWSFGGWTGRMGQVIDSRQSHLWNVREAKKAAAKKTS